MFKISICDKKTFNLNEIDFENSTDKNNNNSINKNSSPVSETYEGLNNDVEVSILRELDFEMDIEPTNNDNDKVNCKKIMIYKI